jgi:hypothetical protein
VLVSDGAIRGYCKGVTRVLQGCYKGVTRVLQSVGKDVTRVLQRCYKGDTWVACTEYLCGAHVRLRSLALETLRKSQGCHKGIRRWLKESYIGATRVLHCFYTNGTRVVHVR